MGGARLDVVELGPKTVATVHAQDPVESGWLAQLQRDRYLDRDVPGPPGELA